MKRMFLEKFFPASRTATIQKEICGIRQHPGETLHEYWERFNKLCATCQHHQISEQLLIQYFYEGLSMMDRSMIDASSGGALMDKTSAVARHLISNMAISNQRLENQLTKLTSLVRQLAIGQHQPTIAAKVCGICTSVEHPTGLCPMLQETKSDYLENVRAIVWKTTISARTESRALCSSTIRTNTKCSSKTSRLSIADSIVSSTTFPTTAATENVTTRQFSISRGPDEVQPGVPAICEFQQHAVLVEYDRHHPRPQNANRTISQHCEPIIVGQLPRPTEVDAKLNVASQSHPEKTIPVSFPTRTISARKLESDEELLKIFPKVEINIPLLDAIKQVPKYARFLKELCVHKRKKMKGNVEVGGIVSMLTRNKEFTTSAQQALPKKCRDPGIFSVPCTIGDCTFAIAMLDLGASINFMPTSIYKSLNFGDLEPTRMTIQLANRSVVQPLGVLKMFLSKLMS
ncbi:hypothetical protein CR513_49462, partial [Mucuna pruriens]